MPICCTPLLFLSPFHGSTFYLSFPRLPPGATCFTRFAAVTLWLPLLLLLFLGTAPLGALPPHSLEDNTFPIKHSIDLCSGQYSETTCDLIEPYEKGTFRLCRSYTGKGAKRQTGAWQFSCPGLLMASSEEKDPRFIYTYDTLGRLEAVYPSISWEALKNTPLIHCTYSVVAEGRLLCQVVSASGQVISYLYTIWGAGEEAIVLIESVCHVDGTSSSYTYQRISGHSHPIVTEVHSSKNLPITYLYGNNEGPARVSHVSWNDPITGESGLIATFSYDRGRTSITNEKGAVNCYYFTANNMLRSIETFLPVDGATAQLYRQELYLWDYSDSGLPQPICRAIADENNKFVAYQTYAYNNIGKLIERAFFGEITGKNTFDKASEVWSYSSEGLLTQWHDVAGRRWEYQYDEEGKALKSKKCCSHGLERRHTFVYDSVGRLLETSIDSGERAAFGDIRQAILTYAETDQNKFALPTNVYERAIGAYGEETCLSYILNEWDDSGILIQQKQYGAGKTITGEPLQVISYNERGLPIEQQTIAGERTTYKYNSNGVIEEECCYAITGEITQKIYTYDRLGRLIRKVVSSDNGIVVEDNYRYDYQGRVIARADRWGNETLYSYDALGRLTEVSYPQVLNDFEEIITPRETFTYDVQDRLISATDCNGWTTIYSYTFWGKPQTINYADGTSELYLYSSDGLCTEMRQRDGIKKKYVYDGLGNMLAEERWANDVLLETTTHTYNAWQRTSSTDPQGRTTYYALDGSTALLSEDTTLTAYSDAAKQTLTLQHSSNDSLSAPITYTIPLSGKGVECKDAAGALLQLIDLPDKENLHITASPEYNTIGQIITYYIFCDKEGIKTYIYLDALDRPERMMKEDCWGQCLSKVEWRYDAGGNKTQEKHWLNAADDNTDAAASLYKISWRWGPCKQLLSLIESGGEQQRTTHYAYNCRGLLERLINPDGTEIFYDYDAGARLIACRSSDGAIDYRYSHNLLGQCIEAIDLVRGGRVDRSYTPEGQIAWEKQQGNFELFNRYDAMGRREEMNFSDGSGIRYEYVGMNLSAVHRLGSDGAVCYSQRYTAYDIAGRPLSIELPENGGKIEYSYNAKGCCTRIFSPNWQENLSENLMDSRGRPLQIEYKDSTGSYKQTYSYGTTGQLIEENSALMRYDSLGNRLSNEAEASSYDGLLQLIRQGDSTFSYDANGNLSQIRCKDGVTHLKYDPLGHLIAVILPEGGRCCYSYDALSRRISSRRYLESGELIDQINYVYDGEYELGEWDCSSAAWQLLRIPGYCNGFATDNAMAFAIERKGALFAPIYDRLGNISCLINAVTGDVEQCYRYTAFGKRAVYSGSGTLLEEKEALIPWGFSGKRLDGETGFLYFGQRFYSPAIARWLTPDPLGYCDGPNRYIFVHNDPLRLVDPTGTTGKDFFHSHILEPIQLILAQIAQLYQRALNVLGKPLFGSIYQRLDGEVGDMPESGVFGQGEADPLVRITMINGLFNTSEHAQEAIEKISALHGGVNIHYIFRHTAGIGKDLLGGILVKLGYISPYAQQLAATWKQLIADMGGVNGGGVIYHYAHSMGGADTYTAEQLMTPEELSMIHVVTFGSPTLISEGHFAEVTNFVSIRDGVCWLDPFCYINGFFKNNGNIIYAGTWWGGPFFDHLLFMDTYRQILASLGAQFIRLYMENELAA